DDQREIAPVSRAGPVEHGIHAGDAGACFHIFISITMNPAAIQSASNLITLLASVMLVLQLLLAVQSMLITNVRLFALQSLLLAAIAGVVGYAYGAWHVLLVAALTILGKVIFLPWWLKRLVRQIKIEQEIRPFVNMPGSIFICGALTVLACVVARPIPSLER